MYGEAYSDEQTYDLEVHGGLTYSDKCNDHICHVPQPGEPEDLWWLGFDANHGGDLAPRLDAITKRAFYALGDGEEWERNHQWMHDNYETYRDIDYVKAEVEKLAEQLANLK